MADAKMKDKWLKEAGQNPGLEVWRMDGTSEQISIVPKNQFGIFKSDDSYLVLQTTLQLDQGRTNHSIHVWIGKATKVENAVMTAANELSNNLGGASLVREVQEHESELFLSYFRTIGGLQYVEPVVLKKQVNHKEEQWAKCLYHLKGKRNIRVKQVEVSHKSLNHGDVFILDDEATIYQWNGASASRMEKAKALDLTVRLRDERMNRLKTEVVIVDAGSDDNPKFWEALGGKGPVAPADAGGDDEEFEKQSTNEVVLYKMNQKNNEFELEKVATPPTGLHKSLLDSSKCFLLDCTTELYVWVGKQAPLKEKEGALQYAQKYVSSTSRPSWTRITKAQDGAEPTLFRDKFKGQWSEYIDTPTAFSERKKLMVGGRTAVVKDEKVNVDELHHPEKYAIAREDDYDDVVFPSKQNKTPAELKIWYVKDKTKHELPEEEYGIFFDGESYILLYTIRARDGSRRHIVYYWQGRHSAQEDKGHAALLATDLIKELRGNCIQCRVVMNKEPEHFLSHFEGYMVVKKGRRAAMPDSSTKLFHVRGTNKVNTHAVQADPNATSLNSNDAFILGTPSVNFVWIGKGANEEERAAAINMVKRIGGPNVSDSVQVIEEGKEPEDFWTVLGGKKEYTTSERLVQGNISARLFHCSDATGTFKVREISNYSQDDLDDDDVMMLDAYEAVYVWQGKGCNENEKKKGMEVAVEYVKTADDGRSVDCPVYVIQAGNEPHFFTCYFLAWDPSTDDVYTRKLKKLAIKEGKETLDSKMAAVQLGSPVAVRVDTNSFTVPEPSEYVDVEKLRKKPWPEGVDQLKPESHLSPKQFEEVFKTDKDTFYKFPKWKQLRIKKEVGIF